MSILHFLVSKCHRKLYFFSTATMDTLEYNSIMFCDNVSILIKDCIDFMHIMVCFLYYDCFPKVRFKKSQYINLLTVWKQTKIY